MWIRDKEVFISKTHSLMKNKFLFVGFFVFFFNFYFHGKATQDLPEVPSGKSRFTHEEP